MRKTPKSDSPEPRSNLKSEMYKAAIAAARITGWAALDRPALVAAFKGRVGRSTAYRWISEVDGSSLDRTAEDLLRDARAGGLARVESVADEVQALAAAALPRVPSLEECAAVTTPLPVMEKLNKCLAAAEDVMARCRDPNGVVRNSKMLLLAAEQLRRSLDTAVKLQEAILDGLQIEQFHATIMEELAKIDPAVAARIAARLLEVNAAWAGRQDAVSTRL